MSAEIGGGTPGSGAVSDRMRALLSRAAEEQLLEQRQVSAVLGELRALVEDVDERLATGEHVDHLAAEVRALSARVEARLDAAEARSAELADRITEATALVGRAAQDLVEAVAAGVAERVEGQLRELTAAVAASTEELVQGAERRLATHVDDAVLALAEVVLRRGRPAAGAVPGPQRPVAAAPAIGTQVQDRGAATTEPAEREAQAVLTQAAADRTGESEIGDEPVTSPLEGAVEPPREEDLPTDLSAMQLPADQPPATDQPPVTDVPADEPPVDEPLPTNAPTGDPSAGDAPTDPSGERPVPAGPPAEPASVRAPVEEVTAAGTRADESPPDGGPVLDPVEPVQEDEALTEPAPHDAPGTGSPYAGDAFPGDGFVLVPADVEQPDAGPAPPVQEERRTADRRTSGRGDGSGRRRRPWWRPV